jgi:hypothetical protein
MQGEFNGARVQLGRILPSKEMRGRAGGISRWTEHRWAKSGEGPPRVRLSAQRWGYPEIPFEQWLVSRLDRPIEKVTA